MKLKEINLLWKEYKKKYNIDTDKEILAVKYDTDAYVEGCFNLLELMNGEYILHLNPKIVTYSEAYVKFVLFHEFTHFYDFIHCPYEDKDDLILFMNAYSEYHACRVTLARTLQQTTFLHIHVDKKQLPGPYHEISIRRLLEENAGRVKYFVDLFFTHFELNDIVNGFRQLMYLFGYFSLFHNDKLLVEQTLQYLNISDDRFVKLYDALKDTNFDAILKLYRSISDDMILVYLRASFRKYYDRELLPDEEIEKITNENYHDYIEELERKKAKRAMESAAFMKLAPTPDFVKAVNDFYLDSSDF